MVALKEWLLPLKYKNISISCTTASLCLLSFFFRPNHVSFSKPGDRNWVNFKLVILSGSLGIGWGKWKLNENAFFLSSVSTSPILTLDIFGTGNGIILKEFMTIRHLCLAQWCRYLFFTTVPTKIVQTLPTYSYITVQSKQKTGLTFFVKGAKPKLHPKSSKAWRKIITLRLSRLWAQPPTSKCTAVFSSLKLNFPAGNDFLQILSGQQGIPNLLLKVDVKQNLSRKFNVKTSPPSKKANIYFFQLG